VTIDHFPKLAPIVARMAWEAKEVVHDVAQRPHLMIRVRLTGPVFPERAAEPFVRIGRVRARVVEIEKPGNAVRAYFDRMPPEEGVIEYGYDDDAWYRFPRRFTHVGMPRLDHDRLPPDAKRFRDTELDHE